jgi:hypothetical protein
MELFPHAMRKSKWKWDKYDYSDLVSPKHSKKSLSESPYGFRMLKLRNRVTISVVHWSVTIVFSSARTDMITSQQMNISFIMAQMPTLVSQVFRTR